MLLIGKPLFQGSGAHEVFQVNKACKISFEGAIFENKNKKAMKLMKRML